MFGSDFSVRSQTTVHVFVFSVSLVLMEDARSDSPVRARVFCRRRVSGVG